MKSSLAIHLLYEDCILAKLLTLQCHAFGGIISAAHDRVPNVNISHQFRAMDFISSNAASLSPSLTLAVTNRAKEMKAKGEQVFGLAGGEPDKDTPENIKQAAIQALQNGATKYTPSAGLPALRQAIADKLKRDNNLTYTPEQICVCSGAKPAVYSALRATISPGDEVIIPTPYWVSYPSMVELCGGTPVYAPTKPENGWKITADEFADAMTPRTKMIILNTPHNPTGAVYSEEELRAIGQVAEDEDILILADEIYEHLVYGEAKHVSMAALSPELYNLTITINGFSKSYAMTGWRLGYSAAPDAIAQAVAVSALSRVGIYKKEQFLHTLHPGQYYIGMSGKMQQRHRASGRVTGEIFLHFLRRKPWNHGNFTL